MIPPDGQRLFAERMGATASSLAASHVAMVSERTKMAAKSVK
jgi:hypothetical protein